MKKALSLTGAILAIIACLPLVFGLVAKNRFEHLTTQLQIKNPQLQVKTSYHLGWLSSRASLSWSSDNQGAGSLPSLQHDVIIHHGPVAFFQDVQGRTHFFFGIALLDIQLPQLAKNSFFSIDFKKKRFAATMRIPFNLHYAINANAALDATLSIAGQSILRLNLDQLQLSCDFTQNLNRVKGLFSLDNFSVNADSRGYLTIPKLQVHLDHHREQGVYLGHETILIPSIDLSAPPFVQFKLNDFNSSFLGQRQKTNIRYQMNLVLQNAVYNNQNYGPFAFDFQINNFNFETLSNIEGKISAYVKEKKVHPENAEVQQRALAETLKKLLPGLIQPNTEIALKQLDLSLPNGSLHSQGYLRFAKAPISLDINALIQQADLYYHLDISKNLAQFFIIDMIDSSIGAANNSIDPTAVLGQLAKLGLLQENSDSYILDIKIKQGVPTVNQLPFNSGVLQQINMAAAQQQ